MLFLLTSIALLAHADAAALRSAGAGHGNGNKGLVEKAAKSAIQAAIKVVNKDGKDAKVTKNAKAADQDDGSSAAESIQAQLNSVLAAGNARLKEAEQEHEKVLTDVRNDATTDMSNRAEDLGNALSQFAADRKTAQGNFTATINATQKGLALIAADLDISERARLGAKIGVAQRQLNHVLRTEKSALESAARRAEAPLDKESDSLMSMWVGDMSKSLGDAKDKMQNIADQAPGAEKAAMAQMQDDDDDLMDVLKSHGMAVSTTTSTTTTTTTTAKKIKAAALVQVKPTASQLEKNIEVAMKTFDSDNKAALKKVNDVIAKNSQDVSKYLKDIKVKLDAASKAAADKVKLQ